MENTNQYITQDTLLSPEVYGILLARAKADPELKRQRDIKNALLAAPAVAGISEASRVIGGGGVNLNPLLKFAAYQPGANKEQLLDMAKTPHKSPGDIMAGLLNLAQPGVKAHEQYQKDRDKFFATQMGRPVGAAGLAGKIAIEDVKHKNRMELEQTKQALEREMTTLKLKAAAGDKAAQRALQRATLDLRRIEMEIRNEERRRRMDERDEAAIVKRLAPIKKDKKTINDVYEAALTLDEVLQKYDGTGNYPGFGLGGSDMATTAKELFGGNLLKAKEYYDDAEAVRAAVNQLIALRNRTLSGLQSTDREFKRAVSQLGASPFQTEKVGVTNIRKLLRAIATGLKQDYDGLSSGAKDAYDIEGLRRGEDIANIIIGGQPVGYSPTSVRKRGQGSGPPPKAPRQPAPSPPKQGAGGRKEIKRQYSKSADKTRILYDDGSSEIVDGRQTK